MYGVPVTMYQCQKLKLNPCNYSSVQQYSQNFCTTPKSIRKTNLVVVRSLENLHILIFLFFHFFLLFKSDDTTQFAYVTHFPNSPTTAIVFAVITTAVFSIVRSPGFNNSQVSHATSEILTSILVDASWVYAHRENIMFAKLLLANMYFILVN